MDVEKIKKQEWIRLYKKIHSDLSNFKKLTVMQRFDLLSESILTLIRFKHRLSCIHNKNEYAELLNNSLQLIKDFRKELIKLINPKNW